MQILEYTKFEFKYPKLNFQFQYQGKDYPVWIELNEIPEKKFTNADPGILNNIFFHLGMSAIPLFFGLADFDKIIIHPFSLADAGLQFFQKYYQQGLGEFRYTNNLDVAKKIKLVNAVETPKLTSLAPSLNENALLLGGAGKDSAVAAEILKNTNIDFSWCVINSASAKEAKIKSSKVTQATRISMLKFTEDLITDRQYRGHYPLSGYLTFAGLLAAYLNQNRYLIAGNEYSANFGNLKIKGIEINHQYTKSFEFETKINQYIQSHILKDFHYFSILRPLWEIQIAKLFARYPVYFDNFISCNLGQNKGFWCKDCPKCAFVFLILYPFLKKADILKIFGQDLFLKPELTQHFLSLIDNKEKPFECVGTPEESRLALLLSLKKNPRLEKEATVQPLIQWLKDNLETDFETYGQQLNQELLVEFKRENNFPEALAAKINQYFADNF